MGLLYVEQPGKLPGPYKQHPRTGLPEPHFNSYGNSVHNPNYENNVLMRDPLLANTNRIDAGSYEMYPVPPGKT